MTLANADAQGQSVVLHVQRFQDDGATSAQAVVRPLALQAPWPQPSVGPTRIAFSVGERSWVQAAILDVRSRRVRTLLAAKTLDAGGYG